MRQPRKKSQTITITKQQTKDIRERLAQVEAVQAQAQAASAQLSNYLSGVVAGHGFGVVVVTSMDDTKMTLTFTPRDQ